MMPLKENSPPLGFPALALFDLATQLSGKWGVLDLIFFLARQLSESVGTLPPTKMVACEQLDP